MEMRLERACDPAGVLGIVEHPRFDGLDLDVFKHGIQLDLPSVPVSMRETTESWDLLLEEVWRRWVHALHTFRVLRGECSDDRRAVASECHERLQVRLKS